MNARAQLEYLYHGGPAAPEAPPTTAPVREAPGREAPERVAPGRPAPGRPDPWRRKFIKPGHEPRPKSRYTNRVHAEALEFLKLNDLGEFAK